MLDGRLGSRRASQGWRSTTTARPTSAVRRNEGAWMAGEARDGSMRADLSPRHQHASAATHRYRSTTAFSSNEGRAQAGPHRANPAPRLPSMSPVGVEPTTNGLKVRRSTTELRARLSKARKEKSDPYGIRTRVAGVKGRCPRPLDEGVGGAAFYMLGRLPARGSGRGVGEQNPPTPTGASPTAGITAA